MLQICDTSGAKESTSKLGIAGFNHLVSHEEFENNDKPEHWSTEKSICENIEIFLGTFDISIKKSAVKLIEKIHQNKCVEHDCVENQSIS